MNKKIKGVSAKFDLFEIFSTLSFNPLKELPLTALVKRPGFSVEELLQFQSEGILPDMIVVNDLFRKMYLQDDSINPDNNALQQFLERESLNKKLNMMSLQGVSVETDILYNAVKSIIFDWIGHGPTFPITPQWTRGATSSLKRGSCVGRRLASMEMSTNLINSIDGREDIFFVSGDEYQGTSELFYVPKRGDISRVCVKPSTGNVVFQRGLADQLFSRYQNATGLDMSSVQPRHHMMAREASIDLINATFDGKDASNSIFWQAVVQTFPQGWVDAFQASREEIINISFVDDKGNDCEFKHHMEMAAPNGCGWTFEMETILFHAIAVVSCNMHDVNASGISVCGDDVILPSVIFDQFAYNMKKVGVLTNDTKSFRGDSPFRESCGGDFLSGYPTRGHYVKVLPTSIPAWYRLVNGIREKYYYNHDTSWSCRTARELWLRCVRNIPLQSRMFGPRFLGNRVIQTESSALYTTKGDVSLNGTKLPYSLRGSREQRERQKDFLNRESSWSHVICMDFKIPSQSKTDFPTVVREIRLSGSSQMDWVLSGDLRLKGSSLSQDGFALLRAGEPTNSVYTRKRGVTPTWPHGTKAHYKYGEIIEYLPSEDGSYDHMYHIGCSIVTQDVNRDLDADAVLTRAFTRAVELYLSSSSEVSQTEISRFNASDIARWVPAINLPRKNMMDLNNPSRFEAILATRRSVSHLRERVMRRKLVSVTGAQIIQNIEDFNL